ncbi:MAG: hypothetical protein KDK07_08070 [Bauldia sp.]|nr:hypothetical protein [Bauldia sp.]
MRIFWNAVAAGAHALSTRSVERAGEKVDAARFWAAVQQWADGIAPWSEVAAAFRRRFLSRGLVR